MKTPSFSAVGFVLALGFFNVSESHAIDPLQIDPLLPPPPTQQQPIAPQVIVPPDYSSCNIWLTSAAVIGSAAAQAGYDNCIANILAAWKIPLLDPVSPPWIPK